MNHSQKQPISIEEISKLIRDTKFINPSVHEKFDMELFTLGYLSALQSLNNINRILANIQGLVAIRNLEANGKITTQEKLETLQGILNLGENPFNNAKLSNLNVLPEKWDRLDQTLNRGKKEEKSLSPEICHKRSKSIEGKKNIVYEKVTVENKNEACFLCGNNVKGINQNKIQGCGHVFHDNCLKLYLQNEVNKRSYPIVCPIGNCRKEIAPAVLLTKLDSETGKRFWDYAFAKSMKKPDNHYSWCPTQGCHYFYVTPKPMLMMFRCPLCQKHYCLNCKTEYHKGQSCDTYQKTNNIQASKIENDLIRFKQCKKCSKWVEYQNNISLKCGCSNFFCVACEENPSKCACQEKESQTLPGFGDVREDTLLYKMIMQDQENDNARLKGDYFGGNGFKQGEKHSFS